MRRLGELGSEQDANRLVAYLNENGVDAEVRDADDATPSVWAHNEDEFSKGQSIFKEFVQNPSDSKYKVKLRKKTEESSFSWKKRQQKDRSRYVDVRSEIFSRHGGENRVTVGIIVTCGIIFIMFQIPAYFWLRPYLFYLPQRIFEGEVWRLVTPIFMHGDMLHIIFNMLWLHSLGSQIERIAGKPRYILGLILCAIIVNTGQFLASGPAFLGYSGVIYAYVGYVWTMSRFQVGSEYVMAQETLYIMIAWLFICLFFFSNVANTQHFLGFGLGLAWGYWRSGGLKAMIRRNLRNKLR